MAEGAIAQLKDAPGAVIGTAKSKPIFAAGVLVVVLVLVIVVEAFKPGLITGPIRKGLRMVGLKNA